MTANPETLEKIVNTIRSEVPKYLSPEFVVHDVTAENRPGQDDEEYVHIRVILEYDHSKLDPHARTNGSFPVETTRDTKHVFAIHQRQTAKVK